MHGHTRLQHHHQVCLRLNGLITSDDETAYREEVSDLAVCCWDNNLSPNVSKTKELMVNYRKQGEHAPIHIDGAAVERVESFKFLVSKTLRT